MSEFLQWNLDKTLDKQRRIDAFLGRHEQCNNTSVVGILERLDGGWVSIVPFYRDDRSRSESEIYTTSTSTSERGKSEEFLCDCDLSDVSEETL